ncbi:MAG: hypothetical protein IKR52_02915 [Paludibacteraceae bacterium]|nr:hypothetical protein [Paludibacteraceae bacterium]
MKKAILSIIIFISSASTVFAQCDSLDIVNNRDKLSFSIGMGYDHSAIGLGLIGYPQKNIGIFANGGNGIAGLSYSVGIKGRYITRGIVDPYIMAMYGYSGSIYLRDRDGARTKDSKVFTDPAIGGGIDVHLKNSKGYFSFGIIAPFNKKEQKKYRDKMEEKGYEFRNGLILPIGISISFKLRII